ncbi:LVIVD repeat-containing protein [Chitinophaga sp. GCM10012297]|uniref:LVIVD repeat-containing protein n=1 Tax=Chitinophaga chungangae TaxID=2821488 RepID=A0ABS3YD97_9BACT|nr:hypothetical protein [Chitinophaga chungangae]MBO9152662.1 hypothetical protein [Chitinophaga chungangae]
MRHCLISIPFVAVMLLALSGCVKENCQNTVKTKIFIPVYKGLSEVRAASELTLPAREMEGTGKIYVNGKYILVNEPAKGIHVIDNSDPRAPRAVAFLNVMGNMDMAVQDNILYADNFRDLVLYDISDVSNIRFLKRFESVMGYSVDHAGRWMGVPSTGGDSLLVGYEARDTSYVCPCSNPKGEDFVVFDNQVLTFNSSSFKASASGGTGKGGSMARFAIAKNRLYTVDLYALTSFNIANPANPVKAPEPLHIGSGIETIFPYQDYLYIGSNSAMYIYDLADPDKPVRRSAVSHVKACDPVVVEGTTAYVTVRTGTFCQGTVNELQVYDVKTPDHPVMLASYQMSNPHGLGVDNGRLFICEGGFGLRFLNAPSAAGIKQVSHQTGFNAYDVIPFPGENRLLVTAVEGLYQYDYSSMANPVLLSRIPVKH